MQDVGGSGAELARGWGGRQAGTRVALIGYCDGNIEIIMVTQNGLINVVCRSVALVSL